MIPVDNARLRDDLETNATFGRIETEDGHGRTVQTGTLSNRQARDYLVSRMQDAGLDVSIDSVGNIAGRWAPATADSDAPPIVTGSHLDSVPEGGMFDGPLGVYAGLEAVRALQESDQELHRPVEVVSFTGEEGSRFPPLVGSSVAAGNQPLTAALDSTDPNGTTLKEVLSGIKYLGDERLDASRWDSFLELHVEQGSRLEREGVSVGIVSSITGIIQIDAWFEGETDHAGTTSMVKRRDALAAAAEFVSDVEEATTSAPTSSESLVGTVGKLNVTPNATNVVPGSVVTGIDIRDIQKATMETVEASVAGSLQRIKSRRDIDTGHEKVIDVDPTRMSDRCRNVLRDSAASEGVGLMELHSGAGHDSMQIASVTDVGMLFAPSRNGISHSPAEWTDWEDCARATRVLARGIMNLSMEG